MHIAWQVSQGWIHQCPHLLMKVPIAVLVPPGKGHSHRPLSVTSTLSLLTSVSHGGALTSRPEAPGPALSWERRVGPPSRPPGRPTHPPSCGCSVLASPGALGSAWPDCQVWVLRVVRVPEREERGFVAAQGLAGAAAASHLALAFCWRQRCL